MRSKCLLYFVLCIAYFGSLVVSPIQGLAQERPEGMVPGRDPFEGYLFPPDKVMSHQSQIGLEAGQRQQIIEEVQALQSEVVPWQFEIQESIEKMRSLLSQRTVDEAKVLALAEQITRLEGRVKHRHLAMMIRVKNLLNPEQQAKLRAMR